MNGPRATLASANRPGRSLTRPSGKWLRELEMKEASTDRNDRDSPIGVFLHAQSYLRAADALAHGVEEGKLQLRFDAPIRHLYAHALEVVLKAHLLARGVPAKELRRKHGHNLVALYDACCKRRLSLGHKGWADRRRVVALMNQGHTGPDYVDRYLKVGFSRLPTITACSALCRQVSDAVYLHVYRDMRKQ